VVQNLALQKYSRLDQSLFNRLVRLQVPTIDLDAQGRCRAGLAALFNWRYKALNNLPAVLQQEQFQTANAGFVHDYQMIDVQDLNGMGEHEPTPHFIQNLGEAEYVVAVYQYMRLLGYV
jgi:intron-binding protein aquarius